MSAGFIRRFESFPGVEVITAIEGITIVDLAAPGAIAGIANGVVGLVGEFTDMGYATAVSTAGVVSRNIQPQEIYNPSDLVNKFGGFDSTLGEFGVSGGNGYVWIARKSFARLICAPINLCSDRAVRCWRELPTNKAIANPTEIVPLQAATVAAGTEFKSAGNRVRIGTKANFTADPAIFAGIAGTAAHVGGTAEHNTFSDTATVGVDFTKAHIGDVMVLGVIGAAGSDGANAGTYRIQAINSATSVELEKMDGSLFDFTVAVALAWRLHPGATADTAPVVGKALAADGGYNLPARPLDATIVAGTSLLPTVAAAAGTASSWDSLSGLTMITMPAAALTYTAALQAPNAASSASFQVEYQYGLDALAVNSTPTSDVKIVCTARNDSVIRAAKLTHVLACSSSGLGRIAINVPELTVVSLSNTVGDIDTGAVSPGVGAHRSDRMIYSWPGALTYVPEAVGFSLKGADGALYDNGQLDVAFDAWFASILSNLAPERNPGQAASPVDKILSTVLGIQRGVSTLGMTEYMVMRSKGIAGLNIMTTSIQSGITTSLVSGKKNINRRRFADFIQDSVAAALVPYNKLPLTRQLRDTATGQIVSFFETMLAKNNPPAQRIDGYTVNDTDGNTVDTLAQGIYVIIGNVKMTPTADFIVFQSTIGEDVEVSVTAE